MTGLTDLGGLITAPLRDTWDWAFLGAILDLSTAVWMVVVLLALGLVQNLMVWWWLVRITRSQKVQKVWRAGLVAMLKEAPWRDR